MIVMFEEPVSLLCSSGVRAPYPGVGPLVGEGAVEALDLAVGLGTLGQGADVGDSEVGEEQGTHLEP